MQATARKCECNPNNKDFKNILFVNDNFWEDFFRKKYYLHSMCLSSVWKWISSRIATIPPWGCTISTTTSRSTAHLYVKTIRTKPSVKFLAGCFPATLAMWGIFYLDQTTRYNWTYLIHPLVIFRQKFTPATTTVHRQKRYSKHWQKLFGPPPSNFMSFNSMLYAC